MSENYVRVLNKYNRLPVSMRNYFTSFPNLIPSPTNNERTWEILIAYLFMKVEQAQYNIVYGAITKKYEGHKKLTQKAIDNFHMTRDKFINLYEILTKKPIDIKAIKLGEAIQKVRNKVIHGNSKGFTDREKRAAVVSILEYAVLLNNQVYTDLQFKPFGNLRGPAKSHDEQTTKWMLIGMGLLEPPKAKKTKKQAAQENVRQNNNQQPVAPAPANPQAQDNPA